MGSKMEKLHTEDNKEKLKEAWEKLDQNVNFFSINNSVEVALLISGNEALCILCFLMYKYKTHLYLQNSFTTS